MTSVYITATAFHRAARAQLIARVGATGFTSSLASTPSVCVRRSSTTTFHLPGGLEDDDDDENDSQDESTKKKSNPKKRLDVAIVGYPNAGKSQLLNAMLGTKVAAVSKKRHTTRDGVLGVATVKDYEGDEEEVNNNNNIADVQLVFVDTPGFLSAAEYKDQNIDQDLTLSASHHMANVDYSLVVIDAARSKISPSYTDTIVTLMQSALTANGRNKLKSRRPKFGIVLNKVDLVRPKPKLLDMAKLFGGIADQVLMEDWKRQTSKQQQQQQQQQSAPTAKQALRQDHQLSTQQTPDTQHIPFDLLPEIFYTSAKQGANDEGVQDVLEHLCSLALPCDDWLLPPGEVTPMDYKGRVAELVREKIYRTLHKEIPYRIDQRTRHLELIRGDDDRALGDNKDGDITRTSTTSPGQPAADNGSVLLVHQDLIVQTKAHRKLLLKNNQSIIQRIHDTAVPELRRLFQCQVLLQLNVKLKKNKK